MLPNCPEYILSAFAVFRIGGIVVQTSPLYVERELEYQLNDTEAEFMICHASVYERVKRVQSNTSLKTIIVVSEELSPNLADDDFYFEDCIKKFATKLPEISIEPTEDVAVTIYRRNDWPSERG